MIFVMAVLPLLTCEGSDPTAPDDSTILLSANPDSVEPDNTGYGTSEITAQVLDSSYNPLKNVGVTFSASPSGTLDSGGVAIKTDSNGRAYDTLRTNAATTVTARSGGTSAEISIGIGLGNKAPNILLQTDPNPVKTGNEVIFDGSGSIDTDGFIVGYKWEIFPDIDPIEIVPPDPEPYDSGAASLVRSYAQQQNIIVKLTIFDNDGAFDQDYILQQVLDNLPPFAEAGAEQTAKMTGSPAAAIVRLDGGQSTDPDGTIVRWVWSCGNGTMSTLPDTQAIGQCRYDLAGTYTATLTVYDNNGAQDTDNVRVNITQ